MESSIRWWPRPLREGGSQEPQIESAEASEDELDRAGRNHAVKPLIRSRADIFAFSQSQNRLNWSAPFHGGFRAIVSLLTSRFPQNFPFIHESGHTRPKEAARQQVRSQARRYVFNRKRNSRSKQVPRLLRPKNEPDRRKEPSNLAVPGLLPVPVSHKIDPFNTLPVDERGNSQYLISKRRLPGNYHCQLLS
jgi:hypothetical protein